MWGYIRAGVVRVTNCISILIFQRHSHNKRLKWLRKKHSAKSHRQPISKKKKMKTFYDLWYLRDVVLNTLRLWGLIYFSIDILLNVHNNCKSVSEKIYGWLRCSSKHKKGTTTFLIFFFFCFFLHWVWNGFEYGQLLYYFHSLPLFHIMFLALVKNLPLAYQPVDNRLQRYAAPSLSKLEDKINAWQMKKILFLKSCQNAKETFLGKVQLKGVKIIFVSSNLLRRAIDLKGRATTLLLCQMMDC